MLITIFTFFLQFQLHSVYSETTTGKETLFTRLSSKLSWIKAREACNNMSYAILPGIRAARALGKLHAEDFAWIDGKEYTFCMPQKDGNETKETCKYVTVRREDTHENLTYICLKDGQFGNNEEILPFADVENKCFKSSASMLGVENFILPIIIPVNRTYWIKGFNDTSIINSLSPGQNVTQLCIGILKLDHDSFKFVTTSCDETHTVICDGTVNNTALTLTTRDEMMPRLSASKASNQPQNIEWILILPCILIVVLLIPIAIFAFVRYRKKRFIKILAYHSNYRNQGRRQDREMFPIDGFLQKDIESVNTFNFKKNIQDQCNNIGHCYDDIDPPLVSLHNPLFDNKHTLPTEQSSQCSKAKFIESEKYAFTAPDYYDSFQMLDDA